MSETAFALVGASTSPDVDDVLGLWRTPPPSPTVSFSTVDQPAEPPVWRIDLPADPTRATRRLSAARAGAASAMARLPQTADRLLAVVADPTGPRSSGSAVELELAAWLRESHVDPGVAFGPGSGAAGRLASRMSEAVDAAGEVSERIARWAAPVAHVETRMGDRLLGHAAVRWRGDVHSVVAARPHPTDVRMHASAVGLVRLSRITVLRALGIAIRGALLVATIVVLPGGPLLALPATWRFVNRLLREAHQ